jgi:ketosteroid isomerase-like protein
MPAVPMPASFLASADDTENQFYEALAHADLDALMACWMEDEDISCIHPGGPCLFGFHAIKATFEAILSHGPLQIAAEGMHRHESDSMAVHTMLERIQPRGETGGPMMQLLATNVFAKTPQGWRLVSHHASPVSDFEEVAGPSDPTLLH